MSNINKVKCQKSIRLILTERTSGVPPVIFVLSKIINNQIHSICCHSHGHSHGRFQANWAPGKLGPEQFLRQIGPRQIGPRQIGPPADWAPKTFWVRQIGPRKTCRWQIGPRQIGPRQIGPRQIGPRQIGPLVHCLLFTVYCSLFTVHCPLFTVHCFLLIVHQ